MHRSSTPPLRTIGPPDDLSKLIGSDELPLFESLWPSHLVQSLAHYLMHSRPTRSDEALRNLDAFFPTTPQVFRDAAVRLYMFHLKQI